MKVTLLMSAGGYFLGALSVFIMTAECETKLGARALLAMSIFGFVMALVSVILAIICP